MKKLHIYKTLIVPIVLVALSGCGDNSSNEEINTKENIGKITIGSDSKIKTIVTKEDLGDVLFFDRNLSKNRNQSCATCHNPKHAFIDNRKNTLMNELKQAVSLGDDLKSIGNRNTPTINYAMFTPDYQYKHFDIKGGMFHDGRAKNLEEQAGMPLLNPVEMNMTSKKEVIERIKENKKYINAFKTLFSEDIFSNDNKAYLAMTSAIATYERSKIFNSFDSKYDLYLKGEYKLQEDEELGKELFFSSDQTNCAQCHLRDDNIKDDQKETFTSYEYFKLGVPQNTLVHKTRVNLNLEKEDSIDDGLFYNKEVFIHEIRKDIKVTTDNQKGAFKTPTLRNIAVTSPYMHNGLFQKLDTVLKFYEFRRDNNTYTINPETNQKWGKAETKDYHTIYRLGLGKGLNQKEIDAIVAFLELLTDKQYEYLLENNK